MADLNTKPPKVFISYSHDSREHSDRVRELSDRLRAEGIDCRLDQYEASPAEGWPRWMERQIEDADFVLVVCTETYLSRVKGTEKSGTGLGARWESHLALQQLYNTGAVSTKFIPLLLESGAPEHIPTPLQGFTYYRAHLEEEYQELYRHLTNQPRHPKPELGGVRMLEPVQKLQPLEPKERKRDFFAPIANLPFERNPFFTGRKEILKALHDSLARESATALSQAISGLGGIGKTQTALEYAYRFRDDYKFIFWVRADSHLSLSTGFVEIARLLNLPEKDAQNPDDTARAVLRWLETHTDWLLIFDNADQPELLKPFRPRNPRGHTLLTSRAQLFDTIGITKPVKMEEMLPDEALDFLFTRTGRNTGNTAEQDAATQIAKELGYLPLALEQAGAYIIAQNARFQDYLTSYNKRRLKLLQGTGPVTGEYPESVLTTWAMNFSEVEKISEASSDLLRLSAFLSPDSIPLELITKGKAELGPSLSTALADVDSDPLLLNEVLEPLTRYSLIRLDNDSQTYNIHRLVQEVLKEGIDAETQRLWAESAVHALYQTFPDVEFKNWPLCERLIPQAKAALKLIEEWDIIFEEAARLLSRAAFYNYQRGQYADAEPLLKRSLYMSEKALGRDHPNVATDLNNLAALYESQGKYVEAEPLCKRAISIIEKAPGPNYSIMAQSLNNLAALYDSQGKYIEAEPLYKCSLSIREKALGPHHPGLAVSLNNLAILYYTQHKYDEAEPLFNRAITIYEKALGPNHPRLAIMLKNFAALLRETDRDGEATRMDERVQAIRARHEQENVGEG